MRNHLIFLAVSISALVVTTLTTVTVTTIAAPSMAEAAASDPILGQQWGLFAIGADRAWSITTGVNVTVAVVDSGSGPHPDLTQNLLPGKSIFGAVETQDGTDLDTGGHGTHVAGIIASAANNGIGGSGVAPNAKILPIQVLDQAGQGDARDVAAGVRYAVDNGAKVINLSLGGTTESPSLTQAIQYATDKGALVVAAAGNGGAADKPKWPASLDLTIAVTAVDPTNSVTSFDQRGDYIDLAAPGTSIISTAKNSYLSLSGTSMAAGFVAGAAALLFAAEPNITNAQVRDILLRTATDIGEPGRDTTFGFGMINLVAALAELQKLFPPIATPNISAFGRVGEKVVANLDSIQNVVSVEWFRCTTEGPATSTIPTDCTRINNANGRTYSTSKADARKTIRVGITYTRSGASQFALSTTVGPFFLVWNSLITVAVGTSTPLSKIFGSTSLGARSYKVLNGQCKISGTKLIAPPAQTTCTIRMTVAARTPYPRLTVSSDVSVS